MKTYDAVTGKQRVTTLTPRRPLSVVEDFTVPLLQAGVSGFLLALLAAGVLWGFFGLEFLPVFLVSLSVGVIAAWFWRLDVASATLWQVEEFFGKDLNRDSVVGRPQTVRLEIATPAGQRIIDMDGLASSDLRRFAVMALTGRLNERHVKAQFGWPQETWNELRDNLIARGVLRWKGRPGSTAGVVLTEDGMAMMRQVLDQPIPS